MKKLNWKRELSLIFSIRDRSPYKSSWAWNEAILEFRLESFWFGSIDNVTGWSMWSDALPECNVPCCLQTSEDVEIIQSEKTLSRRVRYFGDIIASDVLHCNCHVNIVLFLCYHRYGNVRWIWYAQLLPVREKKKSTCYDVNFKFPFTLSFDFLFFFLIQFPPLESLIW